MTYNVEEARAERIAQRTKEPFRFSLDGREWTMIQPDDAPADFLAWPPAVYARRFPDLLEPVQDETGKPVEFPMHLLQAGDLNDIIGHWIGGTPGE